MWHLCSGIVDLSCCLNWRPAESTHHGQSPTQKCSTTSYDQNRFVLLYCTVHGSFLQSASFELSVGGLSVGSTFGSATLSQVIAIMVISQRELVDRPAQGATNCTQTIGSQCSCEHCFVTAKPCNIALAQATLTHTSH